MADDNEEVRRQIADLLEAGLETKVEPFPETEKEFNEVLGELGALGPKDLKNKLVIAGFLNHPYGRDKLRCMECIYFLVNRKWCDLPANWPFRSRPSGIADCGGCDRGHWLRQSQPEAMMGVAAEVLRSLAAWRCRGSRCCIE